MASWLQAQLKVAENLLEAVDKTVSSTTWSSETQKDELHGGLATYGLWPGLSVLKCNHSLCCNRYVELRSWIVSNAHCSGHLRNKLGMKLQAPAVQAYLTSANQPAYRCRVPYHLAKRQTW
jgi:hypothetical protein